MIPASENEFGPPCATFNRDSSLPVGVHRIPPPKSLHDGLLKCTSSNFLCEKSHFPARASWLRILKVAALPPAPRSDNPPESLNSEMASGFLDSLFGQMSESECFPAQTHVEALGSDP